MKIASIIFSILGFLPVVYSLYIWKFQTYIPTDPVADAAQPIFKFGIVIFFGGLGLISLLIGLFLYSSYKVKQRERK